MCGSESHFLPEKESCVRTESTHGTNGYFYLKIFRAFSTFKSSLASTFVSHSLQRHDLDFMVIWGIRQCHGKASGWSAGITDLGNHENWSNPILMATHKTILAFPLQLLNAKSEQHDVPSAGWRAVPLVSFKVQLIFIARKRGCWRCKRS